MKANRILIASITLQLCFAIGLRAQWVQGHGPFGGSVFCFASDGTTLFAGLANSGSTGSTGSVYRSTDSGTTWMAPVSGLPAAGIRTLLSSGTTIFAFAYDGSYTGQWGVYRSTDHGLSWAHADAGIEANYISEFVEVGGKIFAASDYGLYYTTDNGISWQLDTALVKKGTEVASIARIGTALFASVWEKDIERSDDTGKSWYVVAPKYGSLSHLRSSGTTLAAESYNGNVDSTGIYFSSDFGVTWTLQGKVKSSVKGLALNGTDIFAGTMSGAFRSTNNGKSWTELDTNFFRRKIQTVFGTGASIFIGAERGAYRSTDNGATWELVNSGMTVQQVTTLTVNGSDLFVGTRAVLEDNINSYYSPGRIFRSGDNGANWAEIDRDQTYTLLGLDVTAISASGPSLFATLRDQVGNWSANVRSTDRGATWSAAGAGLPNDYVQKLFANGADLFAGTRSSGIYHSMDNGASWQATNSGLTTLNVNVISANRTMLFAGTNGGGIFRSTDNGATWIEINNGLSNFQVSTLAIKGSNVFAGTSGGGVFRSTDNGGNWTPMNSGLTKQSITSFAVGGTNLFAGTSPRGVFLSTNDGTSWTEVSTGLTGINALVIASTPTDLVAATDGAGVWRRPLSDFASAGVAVTSDAPISIAPNPTTDNLTIHNTSHVTLLNMLGISVLDRANPVGGDVTLDLSKLPSGTYMAKVTTVDGIHMSKIVKE